ncbi:hypothetical protein BTHE68_13750 [Burkholderia sp. THE68]|uniref:hypothetical protein n=1 Tax=Burkholderia sp. THE68 TaxID=758782 RepID=UPI00131921C1|nr:hypothetical protein [Burkholderia sp. THE68]BBU27641.1 hypothetical protein BTHE68_13750 [Burkholderia sp. THE68]
MLHSSKWTYNTAASAGVGLGRLLMSGGMFVLNDPQEVPHRFSYKGFGTGFEHALLPKGFRLPQIPLPKTVMKGGSVAGGGSTTNFDGGGSVYYSGGHEPNPEDFAGFTLYLDGGAGVIAAEAGSIFMTGMRKEIIVPFMFAPAIFGDYLFTSPAPLVLLQGKSVGLIDSIGFGLMFGQISYNGLYDG